MVTVSLIQVIDSGLICALIKQPLISTCCLNVFKINFRQRSVENFGQRKTLIMNNHHWTLNTQTGPNFVINYDFTFSFFFLTKALSWNPHFMSTPTHLEKTSARLPSTHWQCGSCCWKFRNLKRSANLICDLQETNITVFLRQWQCVYFDILRTLHNVNTNFTVRKSRFILTTGV